MSYCRFSSDNFQCDLYCYESVYGFEIHIASRRPIIDRSLLKPPSNVIEDMIYNNHLLNDLLSNCDYENINLPYDGESLTLNTEKEMYEKILELKEIGYNVPDYLIDEIMESL